MFTEIPYGTTQSTIVESIFKVSDSIDGIADVRDESNRNGIRIVLDLKTNADEELILKTLFKKTQLESNVSMSNVMIQANRPRESCNLLFILQVFLKHCFSIKMRKLKFLYDRDSKRLEIINGFLKCSSKLKKVMDIVTNADNSSAAAESLVSELKFTEVQAHAIVERKLGNFSKLNIQSLEEESKNLKDNISKYNILMHNPEEFLKDIREDFKNFSKSKIFKGDARRTKILEEKQ